MDAAQPSGDHAAGADPDAEPSDLDIVRRVASAHARAGRHRAALRYLAAAGDRIAAELLVVGQDERFPALGDAGPAREPHGDPETAALAGREGLLRHLFGLDDAAPLQRTAFTDEGTADEVQTLCLAAVWYRAQGMLEASRSVAGRAIHTARSCGDLAARAASHRSMALVAAHDGDRDASETHCRAAQRLLPGDDNLLRLLMGLNLGSHAVTHGRPADAIDEIHAALQLGRTIGCVSFEPFGLSVSAGAKARLGRLEEALADAAAGQRQRRALEIPFDVAHELLVLGNVHRRRREPRQAREALEAALEAVEGAPRMLPLLVEILAALAVVRAPDDPSGAREIAERAVTLGTPHEQAQALLARGWVALIAGDSETARQDAAEARTTASMEHDHMALAEALELGVLAATTPKSVAGLLDDAVALCQMIGDRSGEARIRLVAARLGGTGDRDAIELAEENLRRYGVRLDSGVADALTALGSCGAPLAVHALGDFQVLRGGSGVPSRDWQSKQARDLLKILIANRGRPVPRHRLMELMWPDQSPSRTGNRLSVLLSTLRRVLDPERRIAHPGPIIADRSAVAVDLALVDVDVELFLTAAASAQAACRTGDTRAVALLSAAERLYGGEFLADDPYEEWAQPLRDEVKTAHVALLRALAAQVADTDQKMQYRLRLIHLDPYDEETHLDLVQELREAGRHGEASRRYRDYAQRMREIGVEPMVPPDLPKPVTASVHPPAPTRRVALLA